MPVHTMTLQSFSNPKSAPARTFASIDGKLKTRPGAPYPLGATWDGIGVNFALFSENATAVELCLFGGAEGNDEEARIAIDEQTDQVWHIFSPESVLANVTAIGYMDPTNPPRDIASTPSNC